MNNRHFGGEIPAYAISYNKRFSSLAGRITYRPAKIELSRYHFEKFPEQLRETLLHEMLHAWCYAKRGETGHGPLFKKKMRELGLRSIYHEMGVAREFDANAKRYILRCDHCATELLRKRRPPADTSCARCGRGRFNARFLLKVYEVSGIREIPAAGAIAKPVAQPVIQAKAPEPAAPRFWPDFPRLKLL
jgi:predicted SprT family Zn-dependent metalloprotease